MEMRKLFFPFIFLWCVYSFESTPSIDEARNVIARTLKRGGGDPLVANLFNLKTIDPVNNKDAFEVSSDETGITFAGSSGVAISSAFYQYLKSDCSGSVSWGPNGVELGKLRNVTSTSDLPVVKNATYVISSSQYRYFYNYCTLSYSLAFADQDDWTEQVDWLALHGYNLPLFALGTEHVQSVAWKRLGLTESDLETFFPGPAFLAWNEMSDLDGPWSGPLSQTWRERQALIGNATLEKIIKLGMRPVFQGFSGHVPCEFKRVFPNITFAPRQTWQGHNSSCLLDPSDPHFSKFASTFMQAQRQVFGNYGSGQFYATDQWNEIGPASYDKNYLRKQSSTVYNAMANEDPEAIWVMQAWFLVSIGLCRQGQTIYCKNGWLGNTETSDGDNDNVPYPRAAAYLSGVPLGKLLILDLEANVYPIYSYTNAFYGHNFIFSIIENFGEKAGMFGNLTSIPTGVVKASKASNFQGTASMMEGINNNPIIFELSSHLGWELPPSSTPISTFIHSWTKKYQHSRYGGTVDRWKGWQLMLDEKIGGVYTISSNGEEVAGIINSNMNLLNFATNVTSRKHPDHNATNEAIVFELFASSDMDMGKQNLAPQLRYDIIDLGRQFLDNLIWDVSCLLVTAFHQYNKKALLALAEEFYGIADTLDKILSMDARFMLGRWIAKARSSASSLQEADLMEYNARNQITLWGKKQSSLSDYARKQWSGLINSYYVRGRWGMQIEAALTSQKYNKTLVEEKISNFEIKWQTNFTEKFPTKPDNVDKLMPMVNDIVKKYLSISPHFQIAQSMNVTSSQWTYTPQAAWNLHPGTLSFLCQVDPRCVAFTTEGILLRKGFTIAKDAMKVNGVDIFYSTKGEIM
eukprot:g2114.t1